MRLSDLVREIKSASSKYINENNLSRKKFYWQNGYGVFSYSMSHRKNVIRYIENQREHHRKMTLQKEYIKFLESFKIEYNRKYLFDFFDWWCCCAPTGRWKSPHSWFSIDIWSRWDRIHCPFSILHVPFSLYPVPCTLNHFSCPLHHLMYHVSFFIYHAPFSLHPAPCTISHFYRHLVPMGPDSLSI